MVSASAPHAENGGSNPPWGTMAKDACGKCGGSGWIFVKKVPCVPTRDEYSGFMAELSVECECVKARGTAISEDATVEVGPLNRPGGIG